jgi:hypothetical protein
MLDNNTLVLDNTKRSCADSCLRKFYWQHVQGLQKEMGSTALRFGSTWHAILEGYYTHIRDNGWTRDGEAMNQALRYGQEEWAKECEGRCFYEDYRTLDNCMQLFLSYVSQFHFDVGMLKVISPEQTFRCPMVLSEEEKELFPTLAALDAIFYTGQIDVQIELNGSKWIMEHKTTGQALAYQTQRLNRSAQIKGYSWASEHVLDFKPEGVLVNFAHCSSRKKKDGDYGKLTQDFARVPQVFSREDLEEWRTAHLATSDKVAFEYGRGLWPCNYDQCYQFGACPYISLCEQNRPKEDTITEGFIVKHWDVENQD